MISHPTSFNTINYLPFLFHLCPYSSTLFLAQYFRINLRHQAILPINNLACII